MHFLRCSAYLFPPCASRLAAVRRIFVIIHHSRCDCVHKMQNFYAARISRGRKICTRARRASSSAALQKRKSAFPRVRRARRQRCKNKNLPFHAFRVPGFDSAKVKIPVPARPTRSPAVRQISAGRAGFHFFAPAFFARGGAYYDNICTKTSRAARGWRSGAI